MSSQYGEDDIISRFFGDKSGFLCDIGAADGVRYSNSRNLINKGWKALLVEPNKESFSKLENLYKGSTWVNLLNVCCYNKDMGEIDFYCDTYDGFGQISTMSDEFKQRCETMYAPQYVKQKTRCMRTSDIFSMFAISKIDFLSIDCEGVDLEVLEGIDFNKIEISLICIENRDAGISSFMSQHGYNKIYFTDGNDFYAKYV